MKAIREPEIIKSVRLDKNQAGDILKLYRDFIEKSFKKKIALYEPLEFKPTYKKFIRRLQEAGFEVSGEIPADGNGKMEAVLEGLIKNFLIENAYYALAEKYIQRIIMNKLLTSDPNHIRVLELGDMIREKLERDGLKKLKCFQEKAKFKTFLVTAVTRLLIDSWREKGRIEEQMTKYGPEFDALFEPPVDDPLKKLIKSEDEDSRNKAAAFLPQVLDKLDYNEKLAIKLKYEKDMKLSAISRTLGCTRFKAGILIKQIEWKISRQIAAKLKQGGHYGTPGR
jgi:RNA polymerase sigma factor (sigma-70 family)